MKSKDLVELSEGYATGFLDFARNDLRARGVILSVSERLRLTVRTPRKKKRTPSVSGPFAHK